LASISKKGAKSLACSGEWFFSFFLDWSQTEKLYELWVYIIKQKKSPNPRVHIAPIGLELFQMMPINYVSCHDLRENHFPQTELNYVTVQ
jgi:hypothetical protein